MTGPEDRRHATGSTEAREIPYPTVRGIALAERAELKNLDFAFAVSQKGPIFRVISFVPNMSRFTSKGDPIYDVMRTERSRALSDEGFVPDAIFSKDKPNPALTIYFDLLTDDDGLQIIEPQIGTADLSLTAILPFEHADRTVAHPRFAPSLALVPHLVRRYGEDDDPPLLSAQAQLRALKSGLMHVTEEAVANYCLDHSIPAIFREGNQNSFDRRYTVGQRDASAVVPLRYAQTQFPSALNGMILAGSHYDQPELVEIAGDLNAHVMDDNDQRSIDIQMRREPRRIARLARTGLTGLTQEELKVVVDSVFIKGLVRDPAVRNLVEEELTTRMLEGTAHFSNVYDLLYAFPHEGEDFEVLTEKAIIALYAHSEYADRIFQTQHSINGWHTFPLQTVDSEGSEEGYHTMIVVRTGADDEEIRSEAFRTTDQERGFSLARASVVSKILGIPDETDRELLEEAGIDPTIVLLDEEGKDRLLQSSRRFRRREDRPGREDQNEESHLDRLSSYCEENGYELLPVERFFMPDRVKAPYQSRISIRIGSFIITRERNAPNEGRADSQTARRLYQQIIGPTEAQEPFPGESEIDVSALSERAGIPEAQMRIEYTTTPAGERLVNCIYYVEGNTIYTFVGSSTSETEAQELALRKYKYILNKETNERENRE